MNFRTDIPISLQLLKDFIFEAKRRSFAASERITTLPDQTSAYSYRQFFDPRFAGLIYADMYNGNIIEGGQESVTIDLVLRWRNQYYGGTRQPYWNIEQCPESIDQLDNSVISTGFRFPEVVSTFLKMALLQLPRDFPVRGPRLFQASEINFEGLPIRGEWKYVNDWRSIRQFDSDDPFASFVGQEGIFLNSKEVYFHSYQGGLIRDKYFPFVLE